MIEFVQLMIANVGQRAGECRTRAVTKDMTTVQIRRLLLARGDEAPLQKAGDSRHEWDFVCATTGSRAEQAEA